MTLFHAAHFELLVSVAFIPGLSASKTSLFDDFVKEASVFLKAALYKYSENEDSLGDDHEDPHIKIGLSQADVVQEFIRVGSVNASFFEISISDEELKQLLVVAPYIYGLYLNTSGLNNNSLKILTNFTALRSLNLRFNRIDLPSWEFFQS